MPICGECNHFKPQVGITEALGFCAANKENPHKRIRYHVDAGQCANFTPLEGAETDADQTSSMSLKLRRYKEFEEKKPDVKVDPDKLKDSQYWG